MILDAGNDAVLFVHRSTVNRWPFTVNVASWEIPTGCLPPIMVGDFVGDGLNPAQFRPTMLDGWCPQNKQTEALIGWFSAVILEILAIYPLVNKQWTLKIALFLWKLIFQPLSGRVKLLIYWRVNICWLCWSIFNLGSYAWVDALQPRSPMIATGYPVIQQEKTEKSINDKGDIHMPLV